MQQPSREAARSALDGGAAADRIKSRWVTQVLLRLRHPSAALPPPPPPLCQGEGNIGARLVTKPIESKCFKGKALTAV